LKALIELSRFGVSVADGRADFLYPDVVSRLSEPIRTAFRKAERAHADVRLPTRFDPSFDPTKPEPYLAASAGLILFRGTLFPARKRWGCSVGMFEDPNGARWMGWSYPDFFPDKNLDHAIWPSQIQGLREALALLSLREPAPPRGPRNRPPKQVVPTELEAVEILRSRPRPPHRVVDLVMLMVGKDRVSFDEVIDRVHKDESVDDSAVVQLASRASADMEDLESPVHFSTSNREVIKSIKPTIL
jgi:hypothetical protein